ncbi:general transcription factor IIH subunit 1-like isoform X2 [Tachypleus tridentatus]|uniref:general transcription factor IIH subunit 1-like isoform X2 n=1 Tax=Tachypleus tridentatus TaxID=6853 RepID=UPI003FD537C0
MGTSSEDVLLMVNHVRHKKSDGTLYLMAERIAWMLEGKETFSVSHKYADIKMQKISPEGKSKVQLQVVLHNGDTTTFHFINPMGVEFQLVERNDVKELLQQLLPKFKQKVNKELEEKNRMLQEDPQLFQLYRDLVVSQVITPEEFWANHAAQRKAGIKQTIKQSVGVSPAFLAGIKPQTDGCNGLKYNITADIIESIFKTYPAVKKKHLENVPHKMSESEFWTRFFQSHYFHRDRLNAGSKDLFSECAKNDEQDIKQAVTEELDDPFINIGSFEDKTLSEDYGISSSDCNSKPHGAHATNQSMIRRFNHHSMMVLRTCESQKSVVNDCSNASANGAIPAKKSPSTFPNGAFSHKLTATEEINDESHDVILKKKMKLQEKTYYEDLVEGNQSESNVLNLTRSDRYLNGPIPHMDCEEFSNEDFLQTSNLIKSEISQWCPNLTQVITSTTAISALGELSPGGALMKGSQQIPLKESVPIHFQEEIQQLYSALCELLRHFWSCFPTTTPLLEEKVVRMKETLERFHSAKLQPFQDRLLRDQYSTELTSHLVDMVQTAYNKFNKWQDKKLSLQKPLRNILI